MTKFSRESENAVRKLVKKGEFEIKFQPIVAPSEQRVVAFEVLSRFDPQHRPGKTMGTRKLITHIKQLQLTLAYDFHVLDKTLAAMVWLKQHTGLNIVASVNVCGASLVSGNFVSGLTERLRALGIQPGSLQIEVSENAVLIEQVYQSVAPQLMRHGVRLVVDEFLTGESGFDILAPAVSQTLKVDEMIAHSLTESELAGGFLRGLLQLTTVLGKELVVTGVDSEAIFQWVRDMGCTLLQGEYFAKPMSVAHIPNYIASLGSGES